MGSFFNDILYILKSRFLVLISGIVFSIITARYLVPEQNGIVASLLAYADIIITIGALGIGHSCTYFIGKKKYSIGKIFHCILTIWIVVSAISIVASVLLIGNFNSIQSNHGELLLITLYIPFNLFNNYSHGFFLGTGNIKQYSKVNWIPDFIKLLLVVIMLPILNMSIIGVLISLFLGQFILSIVLIRKLVLQFGFKLSLDLNLIKEIMSLGLIYALSQIITNLNYKLDLLLLAKYSTQYEVGIYSKGVSIVQYLWEIPTVLSAIIFSRSANSRDPMSFSVQVCTLLRLCTPIIFIGAITFYFVSEILMVSLYGTAFKESSDVQRLLLPGILFLTVFKILNMDLVGKGLPWISMYSMVPGLILNIVLNYILDPIYGAKGAAISSTISYTFISIIFLFSYSKKTMISINSIYSYKRTDFEYLYKIIKK